ncbi:MAG TPA: hypothetical protein VG056_15815, partial [Pirellulales bacterium]|nr:hypothetical protein [Pirellulales bacterium]
VKASPLRERQQAGGDLAIAAGTVGMGFKGAHGKLCELRVKLRLVAGIRTSLTIRHGFMIKVAICYIVAQDRQSGIGFDYKTDSILIDAHYGNMAFSADR